MSLLSLVGIMTDRLIASRLPLYVANAAFKLADTAKDSFTGVFNDTGSVDASYIATTARISLGVGGVVCIAGAMFSGAMLGMSSVAGNSQSR